MIQNGRLALFPGVSPAQRERQAVDHLVRAFGKGGIARVIELLPVVRSPRDERRGRFDTPVFGAEDDARGVISPTFVEIIRPDNQVEIYAASKKLKLVAYQIGRGSWRERVCQYV